MDEIEFTDQKPIGSYRRMMWYNSDGTPEYSNIPIYANRDICLIYGMKNRNPPEAYEVETSPVWGRLMALHSKMNATHQVLIKWIDGLIWINIPISDCQFDHRLVTPA